MTWREDKHPRDRLGHFINVGAHVRLSGGAEGSVIRTLAGARVEVRRDDNGKHVAVGVGNITVLSEADGSKPAKPNIPTAATGKPSAQPAGTPDLSTPEGLHAHLQTHPGGDKVPAFTAEHLAAYTNMHDRAHALGVDTHSHDATAAMPAPAAAPRKPRAPRKPKVMPDNEGAQKVDAALALLDNVRGPEADAMDEAGRNYADAIDTNARSPEAAQAGAAFAGALDALAATLNPETDRLNLETVQAAHDVIRPEHRPKRDTSVHPDQLTLANTGPSRAPRTRKPPPAVAGPVHEGPFRSQAEATAALARIPVEGRPDGTGTLDDPIDVGDNLDAAVQHLSEGKHVRVNQQADLVSSLLHEISKFNADAHAHGQKATLDLCKVSVGQRNLFCAGNKGVPRAQMPQLSGVALPGSLADSFDRNEFGGVDITTHFRAALAARGIKTTYKDVDASHLRASQNELDGAKVATLSRQVQDGTLVEHPIFVTRDGYIIDGHHRWAAHAAVGLGGGDGHLPVEEVDLDIGAAIDFANAFAHGMGIKQASIGDNTVDAETLRLDSNKGLSTRFKMTEKRPDGSAWGAGYPENDPRSDPVYDAYTTHITDEIHRGLDAVTRNGKNEGTHSLHTIEGQPDVYSPARAGLHEAILAKYMAKAEAVPRDRQAVFMAGPPGAGKSTIIQRRGDEFGVQSTVIGGEVTPTNFAVVNPDEFKTDLLAAGIPAEYQGLDLRPAEMAAFVHEESSVLAKEYQRRLTEAGINFIVDGTFAGKVEKKITQVQDLKAAGYSTRGVLVDGNVERSYFNAGMRHRGNRSEPPYEGRFVPMDIIASNDAPAGVADSAVLGRPHRSQPAYNFEAASAEFDQGARWYDNTTGDATLSHEIVGGQQVTVDAGGGVTVDGAAAGQKTLLLLTRAARR